MPIEKSRNHSEKIQDGTWFKELVFMEREHPYYTRQRRKGLAMTLLYLRLVKWFIVAGLIIWLLSKVF